MTIIINHLKKCINLSSIRIKNNDYCSIGSNSIQSLTSFLLNFKDLSNLELIIGRDNGLGSNGTEILFSGFSQLLSVQKFRLELRKCNYIS